MNAYVPTERAQKMPVPKFFKSILTWSPQNLRILKRNPLCSFGKSDMIASHLWLFETFTRGTISTRDRMWGMQNVEPTQSVSVVICLISFL